MLGLITNNYTILNASNIALLSLGPAFRCYSGTETFRTEPSPGYPLQSGVDFRRQNINGH
jgi:hypothetical protein